MRVWAIRVGDNGVKDKPYIMADRVFYTKVEASKYKKSQMPCGWSKDWRIVELIEKLTYNKE